jgi:hypothetical protein
LSCVKIDTSEREFFIVNGVSVYKCHNCTRRGNIDTCVTPVAMHWNVKAAESSLLSIEDKHVENNLECSVVDKLNALKENYDSTFYVIKEILNGIGQISTDVTALRSENAALKCLLTEFLKGNESCSCMKSDSVISVTKCIQSSSKSVTDSSYGADTSSQGSLAPEDIVHKKITMQRSEFSSSISKSAQKILKMEAHLKSGVSASVLKPKMKALLEIKADEVNSVVELTNMNCTKLKSVNVFLMSKLVTSWNMAFFES